MILMRHGESEFNVIYKKTRVDPGIRDPELTVLGQQQVRAAIKHLKKHKIDKVLTSPYTRALQTAVIVAERLKIRIEVNAKIGERAAFTCDIGTPAEQLRRSWPLLNLDALDDIWWPTPVESDYELNDRCLQFRRSHADILAWKTTLVVSHWGFIRCLTGYTVGNTQLVEYFPDQDRRGGATILPMNIPC